MLNFDTKDKALSALERSVKEHESIRELVKQVSIELFNERERVADKVIKTAEAYVNTLANSPKEFEKTVAEFRYQVNCFLGAVYQLQEEANNTVKVGAGTGAAGVAAGVGVAAFAPTAAMAIATTFGTASTGTAIASLSGAAATNAALAWLGGGAIAASGGGMAGGSALLAMAGPIGWTIGGVALVGSGVFMNVNNAKIAEEATEKFIEVEDEIHSLQRVEHEIELLASNTKKFSDGCLKTFIYLQKKAPKDYKLFSKEQKELLASLINTVRALGQLLNKQASLL